MYGMVFWPHNTLENNVKNHTVVCSRLGSVQRLNNQQIRWKFSSFWSCLILIRVLLSFPRVSNFTYLTEYLEYLEYLIRHG